MATLALTVGGKIAAILSKYPQPTEQNNHRRSKTTNDASKTTNDASKTTADANKSINTQDNKKPPKWTV